MFVIPRKAIFENYVIKCDSNLVSLHDQHDIFRDCLEIYYTQSQRV